MPHIEIIVRGLLVHAGRVLLCRNRRRGHVFLPGGHVEFGESAEAALAREMKEELGVDLAVGPLLGVVESIFTQEHADGPRTHHEVNLVYALALPGAADGSPAPASSPADPFAWSSREDKIEFLWASAEQVAAGLKRGGAAQGRSAVTVLPERVARLVLERLRSEAGGRGGGGGDAGV